MATYANDFGTERPTFADPRADLRAVMATASPRRAGGHGVIWSRTAERVGFEPTADSRPRRFSRPLP